MNTTIQNVSTFTTLFAQEGLSFVGVFGSQARKEARKDSDIDILIDYTSPKSLFELARIRIALENGLKKRVDLVTRRSIKPALRANIERDVIAVYGKPFSKICQQ